MRKVYSTIAAFFLVIFAANAQKNSWTTYFPTSSDVIGKIFVGKTPLDDKIVDANNGVTFKVNKSATSFTKEQQRSAILGLTQIFSSTNLRVAHVEAKNVMLDYMDESSLLNVAPGPNFVYAGLRAESSTITFRKSNSKTYDAKPILEALTKKYPVLSKSPLGDFDEFLASKVTTSDSSDFTITVKDPSVYFLIQVARLGLLWQSNGRDWTRYCASFQDANKHFVKDGFLLTNEANSFNNQTGPADVHFSSRLKGVQPATAKVFLKINAKNELVAQYTSNYATKPQFKVIEENEGGGTWGGHNEPIFLFRYPFRTNADVEYKDVLLYVKAVREGKGIRVFSGATSKSCGEAYIRYPESKLEWVIFK